MADYTHSTGTAGTLLIRDNGTSVEFLLRSSDSQTNSGALPWNGHINGQNVGGTVDYNTGSPWVSVLNWNVTDSQDVTFGIGATGTQGFGGPSSFTVHINRVPPEPTVFPPAAPVNLQPIAWGHTGLGFAYNRGANNGGEIIEDEATWYYPGGEVVWVDRLCNGYTSNNDGNTPGAPILKQYREHHIYVRSRNSAGWGPSAATGAFTLGGGRIKYEGTYRPFVRYVKVDGVYREAIPFKKVNGIYRPSRE